MSDKTVERVLAISGASSSWRGGTPVPLCNRWRQTPPLLRSELTGGDQQRVFWMKLHGPMGLTSDSYRLTRFTDKGSWRDLLTWRAR